MHTDWTVQNIGDPRLQDHAASVTHDFNDIGSTQLQRPCSACNAGSVTNNVKPVLGKFSVAGILLRLYRTPADCRRLSPSDVTRLDSRAAGLCVSWQSPVPVRLRLSAGEVEPKCPNRGYRAQPP